MKNMSAVGSVLGSKGVVLVGFDYMQSGLVLVHRVKDDLRWRKTHTFHSKIEAAAPLTFVDF